MRNKTSKLILALPLIENRILIIRGQNVMLDKDLAELYGVATKRLNEQVRRNKNRFPNDFKFQLTLKEAESLRSQSATASKRNIRYRPYVFTEHGALMAANVLNSKTAIKMSIFIIRAFIRLREVFAANQVLQDRLADIEEILINHSGAIQELYEKIRLLLSPPQRGNGGDNHVGLN